MSTVKFADIEVGMPIPAQTFDIQRVSMVRYAGASGDFNPIHWSEEFATNVGLPNGIAHGMLTMAIEARVVTDWVGDPGGVVVYGVRFTRPVVVPYGADAKLEVTGKVRSTDEEARTAVVDVSASVDGQTVLAQSRVTVRLAK
jgi:acyl dehydratase